MGSDVETPLLGTGTLISNSFRVERLVAITTGSHVYDVTHQLLGYRAVLKVSTRDTGHDELAAIASLTHPVNPRVLFAGHLRQDGGNRYVILERAEGQKLSQLLRLHRRLAPGRSVLIALRVLGALAEAHALGIVHGDVKPGNILVRCSCADADDVTLLDYGAAQTPDRAPTAPYATPHYAAFEVMRGETPTPASDVFSVGATLYRCIAGAYPWPEPALPRSPPIPLGELVPVAERISRIVHGAISESPRHRFPSAQTFLDELSGLTPEELRDSGAWGEEAASLEEEQLDTLDITSPGTRRTNGNHPPSVTRLSATLLWSTGAPSVWMLAGDPAMDQPVVHEALRTLQNTCEVLVVEESERARWLESLREGRTLPPWVLVFGDLHALLGEALVLGPSTHAETSRLLISTHQNVDLLSSTVNSVGMHGHVALPTDAGTIAAAVRNLLDRTRDARERYDALRLQLRDALDDAQTLERRLLA